MSLHQPVAQNPVHVRDGDARRPAETGGAVDVDGLARTAQPSGALEGRGGGFVRAVAPEHVSAALNLVIAALIFAPRFDIDVPAPPKFLP